MSLRSDALRIEDIEKRLRKQAGLEADDLVFLTFHLSQTERYVAALKSLGPRNVVIDPDPNVKRRRLLISKLRADRHAAGES